MKKETVTMNLKCTLTRDEVESRAARLADVERDIRSDEIVSCRKATASELQAGLFDGTGE